MTEQTQNSRDYGFMIGLLTGSVVGAGLALWLAPKAAGEVRDRVRTSAQRIGIDLKHKRDDFRNHVADAVARSAHDVEQFVAAVKADRHTL
jgi:gas vesicle protein